MPFFEDFSSFLHRLRAHMLGSGLLSLATFAAAAIGTAMGAPLIPALVVGVGGTLLHIYNRISFMHAHEQQMVDLYREDIAQHLGIAPKQVTIANLKEAAKDNEVIAQALDQQHKIAIIDISTSVMAGVVTFGLLSAFNLGSVMKGMGESLASTIGPIAKLIGIGTVGSISNLLINDCIGLAIGVKVGTTKAAAHDLIVKLDLAIQHGHPISREQVYGVLVAGNPALHEAIATRFGKSYAWMSHPEQSAVLHTIGVASEMDTLAQQINRGEVRPGRLAYMMDDVRLVDLRVRHTATASQHEKTPQQSSFVERLGVAQRNSASFAEQVKSERSNTPQYLAL
jgi:hypothetical protein